MLRRTRVVAGCTDGPCPRVDTTTEPDLMAVQGTRPGCAGEPGLIQVPGAVPAVEVMAAMGPIPAHETVVLVRRDGLDVWASTGRCRAPRHGESYVLVPPGLLAEYATVRV